MSDSDSTIPAGFRQIPGFPRYCMSEDGTILSICKNGPGADLPWSEAKRLNCWIGPDGYLRISLRQDNRKRQFLVHVLLLTMFVGPRPEGMECRHLDGNPASNDLSNLTWGTSAENERDKIRHGKSNRGDRNGGAKLTVADVLEIRERSASGEPHRAIAADFHVQYNCALNIAKHRTWKHV